MHPLLQPFVDQLNNIDKVLTSIPDGLPVPNVYQDPTGSWNIEWYWSPDKYAVIVFYSDSAVWWTTESDKDSKGTFKYGSPFPTELTTAIKALGGSRDNQS